jgi:hypothetical protein
MSQHIVTICISIYSSTALVGPWPSFRFLNLYTATVVYWSELLDTDPEVPDSIPGSNRFSKK